LLIKPNKYLLLPIIVDLDLSINNQHYLTKKLKLIEKENLELYKLFFIDLKTLPKKLVKVFSYKVQNISYKQFSIKYFNEVAYLFLISAWTKNLKPICKYIKKRLDNTHFKKHRSYFLFFFRILNKYIKPNFEQLKIKGLYLVFRGKLGRGGNSRKKVMFYKKGEYSLSNKLLAMNSHK